MFTRILKFGLGIFVLSTLLMTSCEQESIVEPNENINELGTLDNQVIDVLENGTVELARLDAPETETASTDQAGNKKRKRYFRHGNCYRLVFPLTIAFPDETTQAAESPEALKQILKQWRMDNPDAEERPNIVFPYSVTLPNGDVVVIEDKEDIKTIIYRCRNPFGIPFPKTRCYSLVYPVTLVYPDGTEKEAIDSAAYRTIVREWVDSDQEGRLTIKLPFSVELANGDVVVIEEREDIKEVIEKCREFVPRPGQRCFRLAFPATVKLPGGRKVIVKDRRAYFNVIDAWYDLHPNSNRHPRLTFPYAVVFEDGKRVVLRNRVDFRRAVKKCRGDNSGE